MIALSGAKIGAIVECRQLLEKIAGLEALRAKYEREETSSKHVVEELDKLTPQLISMDDIYQMPATSQDVKDLGNMFNTGFIVGAGLDMSQIVGTGKNPDRTVFACIARAIIDEDISYYFLLDLFIAKDQSPTSLQNCLSKWSDMYGWIDKVVIESYQGMWMQQWCIEQGYDAELMSPTYANQKLSFNIMHKAVSSGHFKSPTVPYYVNHEGVLLEGYSNKEDILREELAVFQHIDTAENRGKFGSPEKRSARMGAVKDDAVYAVNWAIYATQGDTMADLTARNRFEQGSLCDVYLGENNVGDYGEEV